MLFLKDTNLCLFLYSAFPFLSWCLQSKVNICVVKILIEILRVDEKIEKKKYWNKYYNKNEKFERD